MGVTPTTLSSSISMQRLALDSIGPLPESEFGFKHILVVILINSEEFSDEKVSYLEEEKEKCL